MLVFLVVTVRVASILDKGSGEACTCGSYSAAECEPLNGPRLTARRRDHAALAGLMLYSRLNVSNSSSLPLYCSARDEITFRI